MNIPTHTVTIANMIDGSVTGHKTGCADLKKDKVDSSYDLEVATKRDAWEDYNEDFIPECWTHEGCDVQAGRCSNSHSIDWAPCANHVPSYLHLSTEVVSVRGVEFKGCRCGCGTPVSPKADYRPGHDARHAGIVARNAVDAFLNGQGALDSPEYYTVIQDRPALVQKARLMAFRLAARLAEKVEKNASRAKKTAPAKEGEPKTGEIKIGRWTYPARMTQGGKAERNAKRDGSGSWEPVAPNAARNIDWS